MHDRALTGLARQRVAQLHAPELMVRSWLGLPAANRAAMVAAEGDLVLAARCDPDRWRPLVDGDLRRSLQVAASDPASLPLRLVEAESLLAGGAIRAGLEVLDDAHRRGFAPAGIALSRRLHQLGHHRRAIEVASDLPLHAPAALVRARSAMAIERPREALRALAPLLEGAAPLPDAQIAGACAVVGASALARGGFANRLRAFARSLLLAGDLDETFLPYVARVAWSAGEAAAFWDRLGEATSPMAQAARLELAVLAGDGERAAACLEAAGAAGAPSVPAVAMLRGTLAIDPAAAPMLDDPGTRIHVWRTVDDLQFDPWVRAVERSAGRRLGLPPRGRAGPGPRRRRIDGAGGVEPPHRRRPGAPGARLSCRRHVRARLRLPLPRSRAGAGLAGGRAPDSGRRGRESGSVRGGGMRSRPAGTCASRPPPGASCVVVAPPGDPFWNGVLPQRVFARMEVVRADPRTGWAGAVRRCSMRSRPCGRATRRWRDGGLDPVAAHRNAGIPVSGQTWSDFTADGPTWPRSSSRAARSPGSGSSAPGLWARCSSTAGSTSAPSTNAISNAPNGWSAGGRSCASPASRLAAFRAPSSPAPSIRSRSRRAPIGSSSPRAPSRTSHSRAQASRSMRRPSRSSASSGSTPVARAGSTPARSKRLLPPGPSRDRRSRAVPSSRPTPRAPTSARCGPSAAASTSLSFEHAVVRSAPGSIFSSCALSGLDATEAALEGVLFERVECHGGRFERARLDRAMLVRSQWRSCDFSAATAPTSAWAGSTFSQCSLRALRAPLSSFRGCIFDGTDATGAFLERSDLHGVEGSLAGADLTGCQGTVEWRAEREREFEDGGPARVS